MDVKVKGPWAKLETLLRECRRLGERRVFRAVAKAMGDTATELANAGVRDGVDLRGRPWKPLKQDPGRKPLRFLGATFRVSAKDFSFVVSAGSDLALYHHGGVRRRRKPRAGSSIAKVRPAKLGSGGLSAALRVATTIANAAKGKPPALPPLPSLGGGGKPRASRPRRAKPTTDARKGRWLIPRRTMLPWKKMPPRWRKPMMAAAIAAVHAQVPHLARGKRRPRSPRGRTP